MTMGLKRQNEQKLFPEPLKLGPGSGATRQELSLQDAVTTRNSAPKQEKKGQAMPPLSSLISSTALRHLEHSMGSQEAVLLFSLLVAEQGREGPPLAPSCLYGSLHHSQARHLCIPPISSFALCPQRSPPFASLIAVQPVIVSLHLNP